MSNKLKIRFMILVLRLLYDISSGLAGIGHVHLTHIEGFEKDAEEEMLKEEM